MYAAFGDEMRGMEPALGTGNALLESDEKISGGKNMTRRSAGASFERRARSRSDKMECGRIKASCRDRLVRMAKRVLGRNYAVPHFVLTFR